ESSFIYNSELEKLNTERINHDVLFREGSDIRLIVIDDKSSIGCCQALRHLKNRTEENDRKQNAKNNHQTIYDYWKWIKKSEMIVKDFIPFLCAGENSLIPKTAPFKFADSTKQSVKKLPANYNYYVYSPSQSTNQQENHDYTATESAFPSKSRLSRMVIDLPFFLDMMIIICAIVVILIVIIVVAATSH
uniref:Uncharacterized protein n=1 Tax=Romanomermis culicivorax TaxID=13658 RepID=A0A915KXU0_ROMCU